MPLNLRPASDCRFDQVSLGECMIRLSPPGHGRLEFASTMEVWVGGGEYNVAYALARLGLRTGWVGGVVDNPVGCIILNHARSAGVDTSFIHTMKYDGVGPRCTHRPQLHRSRPRAPRQRHPLRPRTLRHL